MQHVTVLQMALALAPLQLPAYVLLEIVQWLPMMNYNCGCSSFGFRPLLPLLVLEPSAVVALVQSVNDFYQRSLRARSLLVGSETVSCDQ